MNSVSTFKTSTNDSAETKQLGQMIGRLVKGGLVIELVGDVGSGKTTLAQGILAGLGYRGEAPSPSFTVERVYPISDERQAYHVDFYRLTGHDLVTDELTEVMNQAGTVVLIEWPGNGDARLPENRLRIRLQPDADSDARSVEVGGLGKQAAALVRELQDVRRA